MQGAARLLRVPPEQAAQRCNALAGRVQVGKPAPLRRRVASHATCNPCSTPSCLNPADSHGRRPPAVLRLLAAHWLTEPLGRVAVLAGRIGAGKRRLLRRRTTCCPHSLLRLRMQPPPVAAPLPNTYRSGSKNPFFCANACLQNFALYSAYIYLVYALMYVLVYVHIAAHFYLSMRMLQRLLSAYSKQLILCKLI